MAEVVNADGSVTRLTRDEAVVMLGQVRASRAELHAWLSTKLGDMFSGDVDGGSWYVKDSHREWRHFAGGAERLARKFSRGSKGEMIQIRCGGSYMAASAKPESYPYATPLAYLNEDVYGRRSLGHLCHIYDLNETSLDEGWTGYHA